MTAARARWQRVPPASDLDVDPTVARLFEQAARTHSAGLALGSGDWQPSYAALNRRANMLAHTLLSHGGAPGDRIALLMAHDGPLIAAVLAVLKAARIVVALNPAYPAARLRELIADSAPHILITDAANAALASEAAGASCVVLQYERLGEGESGRDPCLPAAASDVAFLVYTSGSTGRPKAVMKTHRQLIRNATVHRDAMAYEAADRMPLFGALSGGQGVNVACCALLNGATLCPFPVGVKGTAGLAAWMEETGITVYMSSASIFRQLMRSLDDGAVFPNVRAVRLASEPATSDDFKAFCRRFPAATAFVHTLSSSETSNIATSRRGRGDVVPEGRLPVGLVSEGNEIALVDEHRRPVPRGEVGEIVVTSRTMAAGYWRNPALTAEKFVVHPDSDGLQTFYTGDLGRIDDDGLLAFVGRRDSRVKIRGNRIELSEVEDAILRLPGIERAVVGTLERPNREPLLVSYVARRPGHDWSPAALRHALRARLPNHMTPSVFVALDSLPLTPHGKIDRDALRRMAEASLRTESTEAPATGTEIALGAIWGAVLELQAVGRQDNFFELGGDSLLAAVVTARIHEALEIEIGIGALFDHPVLADFAAAIDALRASRSGSDAAPQPRVSRDDPFPLSFGAEFFWRMSQQPEQSAVLVAIDRVRITGPLDKDILQESIDGMTQRHEILRTSFSEVDGRPVQIVQPAVSLPLEFHDLSSDPDALEKAQRLAKDQTREPFDIARPPLIRFTLVRLGENEHWLLNAHHHIICDGWSWNIFFRELGRLYEAKFNGRHEPGLAPPRQYGDYALWQRKAFSPDHPHYREAISWWVEEILAATYPEQTAYRRVLLCCMRVAPVLPSFVKQALGHMLRRLFPLPQAPRNDLPFRRPQPVTGLDPAEGHFRLQLAPDTSQRLAELGRRVGATHFAVRLAGFAALLAAESGDPRVCVCTHFSTRNRAVTRDLFGFCAIAAMLFLNCDEKRSFRDLVANVRDRLRTVRSHGDFPLELLHREMQAWQIELPHIQSLVSMATPHPDVEFAGLRLSSVRYSAINAMRPGFDIKFEQDDGTDRCAVLFDAHIYDPAGAREFMARWAHFIDMVSRDPDIIVAKALARRARAAA